MLQGALQRASNHIWFDRFEIKDKQLVVKRLNMYINDPKNLPILIFPEGTCINNSAVMMFKKGSFEIANIVYPVAIKVFLLSFEIGFNLKEFFFVASNTV